MNSLLFFYGFFALALIQVNGETNQEKIAAIRTKCAANNGMEKGDISLEKSSTFLDNPKAKCYLACIANDIGLFREDNSIDGERAISYIRPEFQEKARPIVLKCVAVAGSLPDRCQVAYLGIKCVKEENETLYTRLGIFDGTN